jgi:hypothetical protein
VECTNWTLKTTLTELAIETHKDWIKLLPLALLKICLRNPSKSAPLTVSMDDLSSYQGFYPISQPFCPHHCFNCSYLTLDSHLPQPLPSTETPSSIKIGDSVYLFTPHSSTSLKPKWTEANKIILATATKAKLKGYPACVHIPRLKLYPAHSYHSTLTGPTSLKISWLLSIPEHEETPN